VQSEIAEGEAMKLTALDQGYFVVSVNNVDVSQHTTEREAIERAANLELTEPSSVVEYRHAYRVKVEAEASVPAAPVAPTTQSAEVLFNWEATSIAPFFLQAADPSRASLVNVGGRHGVRLLTMPGDSAVAGSNASERCDLRLSGAVSYATEGQKWRFKHGILLPDDYTDLPMSPQNAQPWNWGSLFNWHDNSDTPGTQGPLQLMVYPPTATSADRQTGMQFQVFAGIGGVKQGEYPVGPIVRNTWLDFELDIGWTATSAGFCKGLLNGKQFMDYKGPTLHAAHGAYLKLANYHSAHGKASAVIHGEIVIEELAALTS